MLHLRSLLYVLVNIRCFNIKMHLESTLWSHIYVKSDRISSKIIRKLRQHNLKYYLNNNTSVPQ